MSAIPNNPHAETALAWAYGPERDISTAQTEATLALAFEQRTANLIAMFAVDGVGLNYKAIRDQILDRIMGPKEPQP